MMLWQTVIGYYHVANNGDYNSKCPNRNYRFIGVSDAECSETAVFIEHKLRFE